VLLGCEEGGSGREGQSPDHKLVWEILQKLLESSVLVLQIGGQGGDAGDFLEHLADLSHWQRSSLN
jgi:hypothetical protein